MTRYDLVVIGSGPGGQKAAIAAAKLGKRVAIVERGRELVGGVCLHTGTIPSKTIREAILHLTGYRQREVYAQQYRSRKSITMDDLRREAGAGRRAASGTIIQDQFDRNGVDHVRGRGELRRTPTRSRCSAPRGQTAYLTADKVLARPRHQARAAHPTSRSTVKHRVRLGRVPQRSTTFPRSMIVVGGGVIGVEYGLMLATLGVRVTVIDGRERLLDFCDREIVDSLVYNARSMGVTFRLGENVSDVRRVGRERRRRSSWRAASASSARRCCSASAARETPRHLNLEAAGLEPDKRGRIIAQPSYVPDRRAPHLRRGRHRRLPGVGERPRWSRAARRSGTPSAQYDARPGRDPLRPVHRAGDLPRSARTSSSSPPTTCRTRSGVARLLGDRPRSDRRRPHRPA